MKSVLAVVCACVIGVASGQISAAEGRQASQCGVNSLYQCLKYQGIEQRLDELYAQDPADQDGNVSLKQLADYARSKGLHVKAVIRPTAEDVLKALRQSHGQDARATKEVTSEAACATAAGRTRD